MDLKDYISSSYGDPAYADEQTTKDNARALLSFTDLSGSHMARLALFPGTSDADRYARSVRHCVNHTLAVFSLMMHTDKTTTVVPLVLAGVLREVKHNRPVADNARTLAAGLDIIAETCPEISWR